MIHNYCGIMQEKKKNNKRKIEMKMSEWECKVNNDDEDFPTSYDKKGKQQRHINSTYT